MIQHWKIDLTLYYDGCRRLDIVATVEARTRAEAVETAVNGNLSKKYGGDKAVVSDHVLIGDEWIPLVFEFSFDDGWNCDTYELGGYVMTEADLHEVVRPISEAEFMRLIGAMPLPFEESNGL